MGKYIYFDETKEPMIAGVDQELMSTLDRARHRAGIPFIVTSGKRSAEHNLEVGGVVDSAHVSGHAIDLRCVDSTDCFKIIEALLHEGIERIVIGIKLDPASASGFKYWNLHCDNDANKPTPVLSIKIYG